MKSRDRLQKILRLLELAPDKAFLQAGLRESIHALMALDLSTRIDAAHYERSTGRRAYRNGYRKRTWRTAAGDVDIKIPKLRTGTYLPAFIGTQLEHILSEVLYHSYVRGVPPVQRLETQLQQIELPYLQSHDYAHLHAEIYDFVESWRSQPLHTPFTCLWLDVIDLSSNGQSLLLLVALGVDADGIYAALDFTLARSIDDEQQWHKLLRRLIARGMHNIQLVFSGDHGNLRVMAHDLLKADWQYQRPYVLNEALYFITENNRSAIVDAVSDLFIRVADARNIMLPQSYLNTWQPVSMLATAA